MTCEEFLAWEARQPVKYEFDGIRPIATTGVTEAHATIQVNLLAALHSRLRGTPCRAAGSDLKVAAGHSFRYPDAFVVCGPIVPTATIVTAPVVVFEILSVSTAGTDRITKNLEYRATPAIQQYVILEQTEIGASVFTRTNDLWVSSVLGPTDMLHLPGISVELPVAELYAGLNFAGSD